MSLVVPSLHGMAIPKSGHPGAVFSVGLNLAGVENNYPGGIPFEAMQYHVAKGIKRFRYPMNWVGPNVVAPDGLSGLQHAAFGALDAGYLSLVQADFAHATTLGARLMPDLHMFGQVGFGSGPEYRIGYPGGPTIAMLVDLWSKFTTWLLANVDHATILGLDIMNEWINGFDSAIIFSASQQVINAMRGAGYTGVIYVEGTNYTGAWNWTSGGTQPYNSSGLYALIDPLDNLIFEAHCYPDRDSSGRGFCYDIEVAAPGESPAGVSVGPGIMNTRMLEFVAWLKLHGVRGALGEFGFSRNLRNCGGDLNSEPWRVISENVLSICQANNIEFYLWASAPEFGTDYGYSPDPTNTHDPRLKDFTDTGLQSPQIATLQKFNGYVGGQPKAYRIDLPTTISEIASDPDPTRPSYDVHPTRNGSVGAQSADFRVIYGGEIKTPRTITPRATYMDGSDAGGTFAPASVTLPIGTNGYTTFRYTPAFIGTICIGSTNDGDWIDPPLIGLGTSGELLGGTTVATGFVGGLRRLIPSFITAAIRLQRGDGQQLDWKFNNRGDLPRQAIQDWAGGRFVALVKVYDQNYSDNAISFVSGTMAMLNLNNVDGYPEIIWPQNCHMDLELPTEGQTGQAIFARVRSQTNASQFLRQDEYVGPFSFGPGTYVVGGSSPTTINYDAPLGQIHNYGGTFKSNTSAGLRGFRDGTLQTTGDAPAFTFTTPYGATANMGYFRFYPIDWAGGWQSLIVYRDTVSDAVMAALNTEHTNYYTAGLPDTLTPVKPRIVGAANSSVLATKTSHPFSSITVFDDNDGPPTDAASIVLSGSGGGTLSGTGLSGSGPYTLAATSASNLTTKLQALTYAPSGAAGTSESMTLTVTSSTGTSTSATISVSVISAAPAETPYAAPSGAWTPVGNKKGWNIGGAENPYPSASQYNYVYPQNDEIDYVKLKGHGCIRMPLLARRMQPASYGPLDPAGRTDEPASAYDNPTPGTQTNLLSIKRVLDYAYGKGIFVILEPHDFGYLQDTITNTPRAIGADAEGTAQFVDWWQRMATKFKNYPNAIWGLENEPHDQSASDWKLGAVAAINAIAAITTTQLVIIPGTAFTSSLTWYDSGNAAAWTGYTPPSGLSVCFEGHSYFDSDNSGQHTACVVGVGHSRADPLIAWAEAETPPKKVFFGEFGWSQDSASNCPPEGASFVAYLKAHSSVIGWTYFLGGSKLFSATATYSIVPDYSMTPPTDRPQMATLVANL